MKTAYNVKRLKAQVAETTKDLPTIEEWQTP
jgi:hypothetical protein